MRLTGNKGEWSEFYALVKLLSTGKLYAADEAVNRIENLYFPILKILRSEKDERDIEYVISAKDESVEVRLHSSVLRNLSQTTLTKTAAYLFQKIVEGDNRSFEIDGAEKIMNELECSRFSAPAQDKSDIMMQFHDFKTGYEPICGFSIKSELGAPPTLLNASSATNFIFKVIDLNEDQVKKINAINTKSKILDRIDEIFKYGSLEFYKISNSNFLGNVMLIDSHMDDIIAYLLLDNYKNNVQDCKSLLNRLEERNPLGYPRQGMYEFKFKKFLCSVALGMTPAKEWNGRDDATGGYVIVKDNGDVVAYHIHNRDSFETYLLNNTKFERGSTTKHGFASIYEESDNNRYINLNLQIRFI